jgi:hypothetical protein
LAASNPWQAKIRIAGLRASVIDKTYEVVLVQNKAFPGNDGLEDQRLTHTVTRMKSLGFSRSKRRSWRSSSTDGRSCRHSTRWELLLAERCNPPFPRFSPVPTILLSLVLCSPVVILA